VPVEGEVSEVRVRVEKTLPDDGTVTGVERVTATPSGAAPLQPAVRLTVELNPSTEESTTVSELDMPGVRVTTAGDGSVMTELIEKSGEATGARTEGVPVIVTTTSDE